MRPIPISVFALLLAVGAGAACRGQLPPTEPTEPPTVKEGDPGTRTNDAPVAPMAGDDNPTPLPGTGGTGMLPLPAPGSGGGGR